MTHPLELKQAYEVAEEAYNEWTWDNTRKVFGRRKSARKGAKLMRSLEKAGEEYSQYVFGLIANAGMNPNMIVGEADLLDAISPVDIIVGNRIRTIYIVETLGGIELMLPEELLGEDGILKEELRQTAEAELASK